MSYVRQGGISPHLSFFVSPNKPHNKAIYDTSATAGISRLQPQIPVPAVLLHTFFDCHKPHCYAICSAFSPAVSLSHETHRLLQRRNLKRLTAAKTAGTFYPCLPSYFYQYHAVKPHCKAKQSLYTAIRFTRFSVILCT